MGTIWIRELTGGLDTRRMPETTPGGVLLRATDGHINSGGELEKRPAFVPDFQLPDGTVGLAYNKNSLVVFGSGPAPVLPPGIAYQQLVHPDNTTALVRVPSFDLNAGKIYAVGEFADGARFHFYDGVRVADWFDGRARASFRVTGGSGSSQLTDLSVNGVSILSGPVTWATSNQATATAIANAVNSYSSTPEYVATAVDDQVNIIAADAGSAANGRPVITAVASGLELTPATDVTLASGADATESYTPGPFVRTIGSKMYAVSGPNTHFSGIAQPTKWTTDTVGAGFIDMSSEASGAEDLKAISTYQNYIAVFAANVTLIWYVDPDPKLNKKSQVLRNTGTEYPRSVTEFGDNDLFYAHQSGLRSLRARDASNAAATTDIGVPVDPLVRAAFRTLDDEYQVIGLINPADGRFWLIVKDQVFVFSFYQNAKVSAWSTYTLTTNVGGVLTQFSADDAVVFKNRVYVRANDTIYTFGGQTPDPVYDETSAVAWFPYFDANKPTAEKQWQGMDAAVEGSWTVFMAMEPTDLVAEDKVATIFETSYNRARIPFEHMCSHVSPRFVSTGDGPAKLGAIVLHYEGGDDEN